MSDFPTSNFAVQRALLGEPHEVSSFNCTPLFPETVYDEAGDMM